jgi:hypothetical protein
MRKPLLALLVISALVVGVVGCGSSSDTSSDSGQPSKAAFIRQGDLICQETLEKNEEALRHFVLEHEVGLKAAAGTPADLILEKAIPNMEREVEQLRRLREPAGTKSELEAIFTGIEKALKKGEKDPESLAQGAGNPLRAVSGSARRFGFHVCGQI